jgi:hypothetical protein
LGQFGMRRGERGFKALGIGDLGYRFIHFEGKPRGFFTEAADLRFDEVAIVDFGACRRFEFIDENIKIAEIF